MLNFFKGLSIRNNEKAIRKLMLIVDDVNLFEEKFKELKPEEMTAKTDELRERLQNGATAEDILPEAFALAREAAWRAVGMRPFDVQVLGGIVLHQGRIAEMKTGEGKTLMATMPAYLNALSGKGVHIVTVNDYLARRDSEWMGPVYRTLGLSVGVVVHDMSQDERREAYAADIVYGTNNEFGFDYLRDNMVIYKDQIVQRVLNYAIVDEVDSILIDEARTPLIISSKVEAKQGYQRWNKIVSSLTKKQWRLVNDSLGKVQKYLEEGKKEEAGELILLARRGAPKNKKLLKILKEPGVEKLVERVKHRFMQEKNLYLLDGELFYTIDEATRAVDISPKGYDELAREDPELKEFLGYGNESISGENDGEAEENVEALEPLEDQNEEEMMVRQRGGEHDFTIRALLKAYSLFEKDVEYVIKDAQVIIVDEFTGRLMPGRRYSDGLHQAIESKEGVAVQAETRTVASITFQNYFRMYEKLSGMTGTAATEEDEFRNIYFMDVIIVPTNKDMIREDFSDSIYKTEQAKFKAAVEEIADCHERGQPVLVGTISVDKSEMLSRMLKRYGVPHNVLNAVNHEREAEIISQAGQKGAVTISTNMAGRGTDIVLGGNYEEIARIKVHKELDAKYRDDFDKKERDREFYLLLKEVLPQYKERWEVDHKTVVDVGGLHVLGTERHESRRIDNQLRGRSGRQGDPGSSRFYISLEDDLMRLFGGGNIGSIMDRLGMEEDQPVEHSLISRTIEGAQKKVENRNFEIRKHLLSYDTVLNEQRKVIYDHRRKVLEEAEVKEAIIEMVRETIVSAVNRFGGEKSYLGEENAHELLRHAEDTFIQPGSVTLKDLTERPPRQIGELFLEKALSYYQKREASLDKQLGEGSMRELERVIMLRTVDRHWVEHIDAMHELRHEIGTRAYAQRDPLVEYKFEASRAYDFMLGMIAEDVVRSIFLSQVKALPQRQKVISSATAVHPSAGGPRVGGFSGNESGARANKEKKQPVKVEEKIGRNDPCPCGSGKKYKKCCGE